MLKWCLCGHCCLPRKLESPGRIHAAVKGPHGITVDTALRLGAYFGTDAQSWINLQTHFDTELAREAMAGMLARINRRETIETA